MLAASDASNINTLTFLSSLCPNTPMLQSHPDALRFTQGKNFAKTRSDLTRQLYELYNRDIFGAALPPNMECKWNVRLTKTAGLCYMRKEKKNNVETRIARIELSTKVIDSADRLRDTLIHEMCHAAAWILSGYQDGHGPLWLHWVNQALKTFPELPPIGRGHNYAIRTKFSYSCERCGYTVGRHTKSLDTVLKVCGLCFGRFQLVVNKKKIRGAIVNSQGQEKIKSRYPKPTYKPTYMIIESCRD